LLVVVLYLFGWLWVWIGGCVLAVALAAGFHYTIDARIAAQRLLGLRQSVWRRRLDIGLVGRHAG
jgi:hypothetical protein